MSIWKWQCGSALQPFEEKQEERCECKGGKRGERAKRDLWGLVELLRLDVGVVELG